MKTIRIPLPESFTFSQENAARLVQQLSKFESSIMIQDQNRTINAKSLLGFLSLAYMRPSFLEFCVDGSDESEACKALTSCFHEA